MIFGMRQVQIMVRVLCPVCGELRDEDEFDHLHLDAVGQPTALAAEPCVDCKSKTVRVKTPHRRSY